MLGQLVEYANRKVSGVETGFTTKEIRWLVGVSLDGRFTELIALENGEKTCADLAQPEMVGMPKVFRSLGYSIEQASHFLADTCAVIFKLPELDRTGSIKKPDEHQKNLQKHQTFRLLMQLASEEVASLRPIYRALSDEAQLESFCQRLLLETQKPGKDKLKPTDKISFYLDGQCVLDTLEWRDWWRNFRTKISAKGQPEDGAGTGKMLSLATGELAEPAPTHPKVMNLGGSAFGFAFVTYDKEAFESYGLSQGENGAVDQSSATAYRAALDQMLGAARQLGEMKIALWYDRDIPSNNDLFDGLWEPESAEAAAEANALERAQKLLNAIRTGEVPPEVSQSHFYAIAMSGAAGRVMVRDWQTGSLEAFVTAVEAWFSGLQIVNSRGSKNARLPGLNRLLMSLQRPKSPEQKLDDYIKPVKVLQIPFWRAALNPSLPIPYSAVARLMESHTASVMKGELDQALKVKQGNEADAASLGRIYARMGLLKAYHNRKGGYPMTPALDPQHPSKAYQCGRLMCLLAQIQDTSSDADINAGVVQRYYGAASSTPALVLGRLTRLSQHHLSKIQRDKPGLAFWLNSQIAEVWNALDKSLPKTLSLEEQSLFALGYYQQFAFNRTRRSGNPEAAEDPAG
ncbi:type I-C CRISPR-associated protein Cas8c/Csd1 [uncultured Meiothermus sp.]|jgi:CRISPR-associated protein Csd1|uniref:type I-C CRISPR-associated protein Cas8c/Csd1 n=1 Tax=uncultured Meiothermus sp. TaxID=157471 RepID=UPI0026244DC3|nr:type I-C CRISPR-associated protein Cas8c/Csd1 [uncultured Meiothermus sp.]